MIVYIGKAWRRWLPPAVGKWPYSRQRQGEDIHTKSQKTRRTLNLIGEWRTLLILRDLSATLPGCELDTAISQKAYVGSRTYAA